MKIMKSVAVIALLLSVVFTGCKPKDADILKAVEKSIEAETSLNGTTVNVNEGVVSLSGQLKDETAKALAETKAKAEKGVKSVVNNITIAAPVTIAVDEVLTKAVKDAVKDYPTVVASINDGIVSLNGEIKKDALPKLMMALSSLKPKKIDNKLTVK
jgi:hyperosmotically inducible protein